MDVVAVGVTAAYDTRDKALGLKMVFEPEYLRFFQARFDLLKESRLTAKSNEKLAIEPH